MKLLVHLAPHKTSYEIIPTRNIVFSFNASGFETLEQYNQSKNYCFDDLGVEPTGSHYGKDLNVLGEILLSRYDLFTKTSQGLSQRLSQNIKTHITTNLNAQEIEKRYGNRVRSRLRAMFNLISFNQNSIDKRK
jgi:hypothetical protein